ncbi:MAG TPA: hypothetical protein VJ761_04955 [Ktedonobacteraceae bacterium]|nr:hypothetical protein [Ktedonobacteraceae bacterium]
MTDESQELAQKLTEMKYWQEQFDQAMVKLYSTNGKIQKVRGTSPSSLT